MVKVLIGNLFESHAQTLVNTVNCVGVMGKGVALEFKKRFPEMYKDYVTRCQKGEIRLGHPYLYKSIFSPWILNFPTKGHWRSVTSLDDVTTGLKYLISHYKNWGITSLAIPPLGCGQGQLEWRVVGPTLYRYLKQLNIPVELYAPYGTPYDELKPEFLDHEFPSDNSNSKISDHQWIKPAWVALVDILSRIETQPFHWPIGRVFFQKIAYVATEEGLPTGLHYSKGSFGPFSSELKHVVARLINNGLIQEKQSGRMFVVKVGQTFEDAKKAYTKDLKQWEPIIEKIADLFMRMDTKQSEIAATVLFTARSMNDNKDGRHSEQDILNSVMKWKQRRKPPIEKGEVALTIRSLAALGWIHPKPSANLPLPHEYML